MLMPSRAASNGRQGVGDTSSSELKPNSTLSHNVSTPPTTAASTRPEPDQPLGRGEHLGARRAGGRHRLARAVQAQRLLHEHAERMRRVHRRCASPSGKRPSASSGRRHPRFRRCSRSRCRGSRRCAPGRSARARRPPRPEAVGLQPEPGETVVAAIPVGERPAARSSRAVRPGRSRSSAGRPATSPKSLARRPLVRAFERGGQRRLADADGARWRCRRSRAGEEWLGARDRSTRLKEDAAKPTSLRQTGRAVRVFRHAAIDATL